MKDATRSTTKARKKTASRPMGPKALTGSREAKRTAAVLLEVLSGVRSTQEGAGALEISLSRYYVLETRALQGLITALEPRPRGRVRRPEDELESLRRDKRRLEQELGRSQALVRAAQRSLGVAAAASSKPTKGKLGAAKSVQPPRRRRRTPRAAGAIAALRRSSEATATASTEAAEGRSDHARRTPATEGPARRHASGPGRGQAPAATGTRDADR